jgi:hypothetical protein
MGASEPGEGTRLSGEDVREAVELHLLRHIGEARQAFKDADGWAGSSREPGPPIDVLIVPPQGERRFAYVSTFGCSLKPLPAPAYGEPSRMRRTEFVLAAPQKGDEDADRAMLNFAANTVRQFAKLAHIQPITVEPGETVAFTDNPQPVYPNANQVAFAFMPPRLPADGFSNLHVETGDTISFIAPVPISAEELDLARTQSPAALASVLYNGGVTEMIDPSRASMIRPPDPPRGGFLARLFGGPRASRKR